MDFMIEHWKWIAVIGGVLALIIIAAFSITATIPTSETIKGWTVQEAIAYGSALIAFAIFIRG